jgi:hypothetical protein
MATLLISLLAPSCKKEDTKTKEDNMASCLSSGNMTFPERLNSAYQIEFPKGYADGGYIVYQGDFFTKHFYGTNDTVSFIAKYSNNNNTQSSVWGETLSDPTTPSVDIVYNNKLVTLKNKRRLCNNGGIGYYYYTLTSTASSNEGLGQVYLKQGDVYRQSLLISFTATKAEEVNEIVGYIAQGL